MFRLIQKRKAESVSLATQVSPATPVPCLPGSTEASQASVYPAVRDTNTFNLKSNARDDHEQLTSLTTVNQHLITLGFSNDQSLVSHYYSVGVWFLISSPFQMIPEWYCPSPHAQSARKEEEAAPQLRGNGWGLEHFRDYGNCFFNQVIICPHFNCRPPYLLPSFTFVE